MSTVSKALGIPVEAMEVEELRSHYGNPLTSVRAHITGKEAGEISRLVLSNLDQPSRLTLLRDIESSMDEHDALYLRLDRQLLSNSFILSNDEPIRLKLKPRNRNGGRKMVKESYEELLSN